MVRFICKGRPQEIAPELMELLSAETTQLRDAAMES